MSTSFLGRVLHRAQHADWSALGRKWGYRGLMFLNGVCALHLFADNVGWVHFVEGPSMIPTMSLTGEMVIERRWIKPKDITRGDLVTYISPLDPMRVVCKRVIGLPGDVICVDPTGRTAPSTEHVVVPRGHVWLSGDNAEMSRDSRLYGPVSMALVRGKLVARILPLKDARWFENNFRYIDGQDA